MRTGLGWTDEDRVPLCTAYRTVSGDSGTATGRSKDELWAAVYDKWTELMTKKGPLRVKCNASTLEKQFRKIRMGVSTFTSHYLPVKNMPTTGNRSEEDIISGAIARYCSLDIYKAIRSDRENDKRQGKTTKREAKLAHCKWVACWRVLPTLDKFSGATSLADANMDVDDSSDESGESGNASSPGTAKRAYQRRPGGIKAAKKMRMEDAAMEKQAKAITAAVHKLPAAQQERTALCSFDSLAMRNTPEAAKYRQAVLSKMMMSAGVDTAPETPATSAQEDPSVSDEIHVVDVDDGVAALDVAPTTTHATSAAPPATDRAVGAQAPPAREPPAASAAGRTAVNRALAAQAVMSAASTTAGRRGGRAQRGRTAQDAKERAAAAALEQELDTTRGLDHSSPSATTTATTISESE
eukprot:TRINITY_DN3686_c0_g1_i1.p1 TRINITY_DN3686_c0_g1~~TRINITY_DN3686_c0_g1_i1.p1  ORF type:complete len:411 (-),score=98.22 TRINITY_DN3686_c0_g1_i1:111-1343(-)